MEDELSKLSYLVQRGVALEQDHERYRELTAKRSQQQWRSQEIQNLLPASLPTPQAQELIRLTEQALLRGKRTRKGEVIESESEEEIDEEEAPSEFDQDDNDSQVSETSTENAELDLTQPNNVSTTRTTTTPTTTTTTTTQVGQPSTTNKPETASKQSKRERHNEVSRLWHRIRKQTASEQDKQRYTELTGKAQPRISNQQTAKRGQANDSDKHNCKNFTSNSKIANASMETEEENDEEFQANKKRRNKELQQLIYRIHRNIATDQDKQRYMEMTGKSEPIVRSFKRRKRQNNANPPLQQQQSQQPRDGLRQNSFIKEANKNSAVNKQRIKTNTTTATNQPSSDRDDILQKQKAHRNELSKLLYHIKKGQATEEQQQRYMQLTGRSQVTIRKYRRRNQRNKTATEENTNSSMDRDEGERDSSKKYTDDYGTEIPEVSVFTC